MPHVNELFQVVALYKNKAARVNPSLTLGLQCTAEPEKLARMIRKTTWVNMFSPRYPQFEIFAVTLVTSQMVGITG